MKLGHIVIGLVIGCLSANMVGCTFGPARPDGFPSVLYPCEITVTQEGELLPGAFVSLFPMEEETKNWVIAGYTGKSGTARLFTYGKWEGAPAGEFKVVISKTEEDEVTGKSFTYIDPVYALPETTPLTLEVKKQTEQTYEVGKAIKIRTPKKLM